MAGAFLCSPHAKGSDWHIPVRWKWDVTHPGRGWGQNLGLGAPSARFFCSHLRPARGLLKELLPLDNGVCLALPGLRAVLCCQGSRDILGMLPSWRRHPRVAPRAFPSLQGGKQQTLGLSNGCFKPKDTQLTPEEERRSRTEPNLGWCCSLGAQPGASREFLMPHRARVCSPELPHPAPRAGTLHWAQVTSSSPTWAVFREGRNRDHTPPAGVWRD